MEVAPPDEREVFWQRYNHSRRRSARKVSTVGDLLAPWLAGEASAQASGLAAATQLWSRVVPENLAGRSRVESVSRRALRVVVDGKAAAFMLRRQVEKAFLKLAGTQLPGVVIEKVVYRVGRIPRDA